MSDTTDGDTVSTLLAAATASLDTDLDAAKACIQQAADLRHQLGQAEVSAKNQAAATRQ